MVFSELVFLCLFLPVFFALYFAVPTHWRNGILLLGSLVFYAWGEPVFVLLMFYSIILDYGVGLALDRYAHDPKKRRMFLLISIIGNLGALGFFKYADFFIVNLNVLLGSNFPLPQIPLPIGISFYTFQTMSYSIDVYRGEVPAQKNLISFGAYVTMFPQLIAGPIVRYIEVQKELDQRKETVAKFADGVEHFALGLCYKVLLANATGALWDRFKVLPTQELTVCSSWLGIIAFTLQIYFDFGGYSLMAIGMGKMLGFEFPQNFNYPYISESVSEFWRRWHITLGSWFREYVYIPLGGNRHGAGSTVRNLAVVWLLTGIWHGASWNFLLWGCYYGMILILERFVYGEYLKKAPRWVRHFYTMVLVMVGWVLFEAVDLSWGVRYLSAMFGAQGLGWQDNLFRYEALSFGSVIIFGAVLATDLPEKALHWLQQRKPICAAWLRFSLMAIGLLLSLAYIVDSSYNPFLYYRF